MVISNMSILQSALGKFKCSLEHSCKPVLVILTMANDEMETSQGRKRSQFYFLLFLIVMKLITLQCWCFNSAALSSWPLILSF